MIKQESDESGIVAEFQENGQPLLKKIKQEVNMGSFEKNNAAAFVPCGQLDCLAWALCNTMFHTIFSYKMLLRDTARLGSICMPPCNWEARPLLFPSCLNREDARKYRGKRRKQLCIVLFKITDIKMDR